MDDIERLRRRHARERSARLQAEQIAEQAIADLLTINRRLDSRIAERTEELERTLARLGEVDAARLNFLRGAAHEMSTPLHAISGFLELIEDRTGDPEIVRAAKQAASSAAKLDNALRTLREFASLSAEGASVGTERVALGDFADRVVRRWRLPVARSGSLLTVEVSPGPQTEVVADVVRVDQIIDALVDNAARFARSSVAIEVGKIEVDAGDGSFMRLVVADDGPGIPDDMRERVFDPFTTGPESTDGFGVGLTLARAAAEALGGHLELGTDAGATRFVADVPVA